MKLYRVVLCMKLFNRIYVYIAVIVMKKSGRYGYLIFKPPTKESLHILYCVASVLSC